MKPLTLKKLTLVFVILCTIQSFILFFIPILRNYGFVQISSLFCAICASFLGIQAVYEKRNDPSLLQNLNQNITQSVFSVLIRIITASTCVTLPLLIILISYRIYDSFQPLSFSKIFADLFQKKGIPSLLFLIMIRWFQFAFLGPWASAICGASLGIFIGFTFKTRWLAIITAIIFIVGSLFISAWQTAMLPLWIVYNPFFGCFPIFSATQERFLSWELFSLPILRISQFFVLMGFFLLLSAGLQKKQLLFRPWYWFYQKKTWGVGILILLISSFGLSHLLRPQQDRSGEVLKQTFLGKRKTEHFIIYYNPDSSWGKNIKWVVFEHEFRYRQLRQKLGIEPDWKTPIWQRWLGLDNKYSQTSAIIESYLFDSEEKMRQLLGISGEETPSFANPWRRTIYISANKQIRFLQNNTFIHELAHIFLGARGDSLFHVSWGNLLPNMSMIEGFASALDGRSPKDSTAVQMAAGLSEHESLDEIDLASLFVPKLKFTHQRYENIYSIPGSFFLYLLQKDDISKLLQVYRKGGLPKHFETAYGLSFATLKQNWITWVFQQKPMRYFFPAEYFQAQYEPEEAQNSLIDQSIEALQEVISQKTSKTKKHQNPELIGLQKIKTALFSLQTIEKSAHKLFLMGQAQQTNLSLGWLYFLTGYLFFEDQLYEQASLQFQQALAAKYPLPLIYQNWARFLLAQSLFFQKEFVKAHTQFQQLAHDSTNKQENAMILDFLQRSVDAPDFFPAM